MFCLKGPAKAGSLPRAVPWEAQDGRGRLVPTALSGPVPSAAMNGGVGAPAAEGRRLPAEVTALGLGLPGDGVHDGILGVHADGRVVLRVDDGGLAAQPLHLDGLVGRQGRVLQGAGVEAFLVVGAGGVWGRGAGCKERRGTGGVTPVKVKAGGAGCGERSP